MSMDAAAFPNLAGWQQFRTGDPGAGWFLTVNGQRIRFSSESERDRVAQHLRELEQTRRDAARLPAEHRAIAFFLAGRSRRRGPVKQVG